MKLEIIYSLALQPATLPFPWPVHTHTGICWWHRQSAVYSTDWCIHLLLLSFRDGWCPNIYSIYKTGSVSWQKSGSSTSLILLTNTVFGNWDVSLGPNLKKNKLALDFSAIGVGARRLPLTVCFSHYVIYYMIKRVSKHKKNPNKQNKNNKIKVSRTN